jgi:hypothetical protein
MYLPIAEKRAELSYELSAIIHYFLLGSEVPGERVAIPDCFWIPEMVEEIRQCSEALTNRTGINKARFSPAGECIVMGAA